MQQKFGEQLENFDVKNQIDRDPNMRADRMVQSINSQYVIFGTQLKGMIGVSNDSLKRLVGQVEKSNIIWL